MTSSPQVSADVRPASQPAAEQLPTNVLDQNCPSRTVLRHLTDRWTPLIVTVLADGEPVRFKDLKNTIQGVSPKVLTETLRSMERDGLLTRHITASVPPRVDYQLTDLGLTTVEPLTAVRLWAETHLEEVQANRERYDAAQAL
ncbi:transcriptional regulator [Rothia nasimurium]|uniref:Transcriptional regulator n=1 Tax=Rothia nasimurium TaxID=85336 RepID=A0A4Y9F5T9_9MICC|nr:helix-turn-helix domain-containing protein [Rothia nasimurium]MBF0807434.1 helix-turn-helix transcriptional regulator [Rothia nasimurium]TFU23733.1 transcriptional regulator [Rothia nasimurium]